MIGNLTESLSCRWEETIQDTYYVVERSTALKRTNEENSTVIRWLREGEEVKVMEVSEKWVKVTSYDTTLNQTNVGWVLNNDLLGLD